MRKRLYATVLTVFAGIIIGTALAMVGHTSTADATTGDIIPHSPSSVSVPNTAPSIPQSPPKEKISSEKTMTQGYYIKAYNGMVSVIKEGDSTPEMIFDIHIKMLPELDQAELIEGIYVDSYEGMTKMIEDYIS